MSDDQHLGTFQMIFASGNRLGKATAQAMELADRSRKFTDIKIMVVPHPDIADLAEDRDHWRARAEAAEKVCEAVDIAGYLKNGGPLLELWEAWRATREPSK